MSFLLGKNDRAIVGGKKPKVVVFGWLQKIMNSVATFKSPTFPKYDVFDTCLVLISILSEFRANFETLSFLGYFRPMLSSECPKTLINRILPLSKIPPETKEAPRYIHCFRDQREWVFEVREVKSEKEKLSLFFEKCKVKNKCFHSFSSGAK